MAENNDIRHGRHCVFKMPVRWIFVATHRRKVFDRDAIRAILHRPNPAASPGGCYATKSPGRDLSRNGSA